MAASAKSNKLKDVFADMLTDDSKAKKTKVTKRVTGQAAPASKYPVKKFNKKAFNALCKLKKDLDVELSELKERQSSNRKLIHAMVEKYGVRTSKNGIDRLVIFTGPYKAQMRFDVEGGDISMDAIKKHFPEMIEKRVENPVLNLENFSLRINHLEDKKKQEVKQALELIRGVALAMHDSDVYSETLIEDVKPEFLVMLNEGKISEKLTKEIMGVVVKKLDAGSLRVDDIDVKKHGHCMCCGYEKKAAEAKNKDFVCPSCGNK